MAIIVASVQYNGGLLSDIILLSLSRSPFICQADVLSLQSMIPPKRFDIFPPDWGMLKV